MELDKLSDELEKQLMAAETPEELSALAKENGNPLFFNVLKVLSSLGLSLQVAPTATTTHRASA